MLHPGRDHRADHAAAATAVVATDGHAGKVRELGGETMTMARLAEVVSAESGQTVGDADAQALTTGALHVRGDHPETLVGRRPTPLVGVVRAALGR